MSQMRDNLLQNNVPTFWSVPGKIDRIVTTKNRLSYIRIAVVVTAGHGDRR